MRPTLSLFSLLVFLACGAAAGEPTGDLKPLSPSTRALFANQHQFHMYNGSAQAFSADGKTLFMSGHMGLMIWDLADSKAKTPQPRTLRPDNMFLHNAAAALTPDGKTAALLSTMGGNQDMPIRFFDTTTSKEIRQIENDQPIQSLCFSPDGRSLAVGTYQHIELWDAADGDELRVFTTEPNTFYRLLTFSPDGKMLAAVAQPNRFPPPDDPAAILHVWETASGKERTRLRLEPPPPTTNARGRVYYGNQGVGGLAFSTDGRLLAASGGDAAIHLWELRSGREQAPLTGFEGMAVALLFTPDGKELLAVDTKGSRLSWKTEDIRRMSAVRLAPLGESAFAALWEELAQADVFRVYRAARHLLADPERAVALLGGRLKPVPPGDTARIRKLIADLGNANAAVRRKAMMELRAKHGEAAVGALAKNPNQRRNAFGMTFEQKLRNLYNTPERARDIRAVRILGQIATPGSRQVLEKLSRGAAGVSLTVEAKAALDRLSALPKGRSRPATPDELWADLASDSAERAFRAMNELSAEPARAVALFEKQLKPMPAVEEKELASLLARLEADDFKTRERATEELEGLGEQALPALKKALAGRPSLEARKRMERLVEQLSVQAPGPVLRGLRAVEVLEHAGTAEAKHVLVALAGGAPQVLLTREAKAALRRLEHR